MTHDKTRRLAKFYKLTVKQQKAIVLLFDGKMTKAEIADAVGVARTTLPAWHKRQDFQDGIAEYNRYMLAGLGAEAIRQMGSLMRGARSEMVRFNAAQYIIDKTNVADDLQAALVERAQAEAKIAAAKAKVYEDETDGSGSYGLIVDIPREEPNTDGVAKDK